MYPSAGEELDGYTEAIFGDVTRCHAIFRDFSRPLVTSHARPDRLSVARLKEKALLYTTPVSQKTSRVARVQLYLLLVSFCSRPVVAKIAILTRSYSTRSWRCYAIPRELTRTSWIVRPYALIPAPQRSNAFSLIGRKRRSYAILRDLTRRYALRAPYLSTSSPPEGSCAAYAVARTHACLAASAHKHMPLNRRGSRR